MHESCYRITALSTRSCDLQGVLAISRCELLGCFFWPQNCFKCLKDDLPKLRLSIAARGQVSQ